MSVHTFRRDLSRTTLAPPIARARFACGPDFKFLVRTVCIRPDGREFVVRIGDAMGGEDAGDSSEIRHALEIDARRDYRKICNAMVESGRWRKLPDEARP